MKKFAVLVIMFLSFAGGWMFAKVSESKKENVRRPNISVKVYPAGKEHGGTAGGTMFTQVEVYVDKRYSKTFLVDPKTGELVFEEWRTYDEHDGPTGSEIQFILYKNGKPCLVTRPMIQESGPLFDIDDGKDGGFSLFEHYNSQECNIEVEDDEEDKEY